MAGPEQRAVIIPFEQDTTKLPPSKKAPADSETDRVRPHANARPGSTTTPGVPGLVDSRDHRFPELTIDVIDSLGKLYPELKDYFLQQAAILGVLKIDVAERERKRLLDRAFADMHLYGEMEATLRHNQAVYGTAQNPMRPPQNQVNLFDLMTAISNFLHYIGAK